MGKGGLFGKGDLDRLATTSRCNPLHEGLDSVVADGGGSSQGTRKTLSTHIIDGCKGLSRTSRCISLHEGLDRMQRAVTDGRGRFSRVSSRQTLHTIIEMPEAIVQQAKHRYLAHERLLLLLYSKRTRVPTWADPLAHWRQWWRAFGLLLLFINALSMTAFAWSSYRCTEAGPLLRRSNCEFHGQRLLAQGSSIGVRSFSLGEVLLGLTTAASLPIEAVLHRRPNTMTERLQYGTTNGAMSGALLALDLLLLMPQHMSDPPDPLGQEPPHQRLRRWLTDTWSEMLPIKTIVSFRKLKALPPAPWPLQQVRMRARARIGTRVYFRKLKALPPAPWPPPQLIN